MSYWAAVSIRLGLLLLALALVPAMLLALFFPGVDPFVPALLALSVAPLGALILMVGLVMWGLARLRR